MTTSGFDLASQVADAVLYEGYLLYPYRASARKNQARWQFGVLMPPAWAQADGSEPSASQTELLLEPKAATTVQVRLRFLQLQTRADGDESWDEGVEQQVDAALELDELLGAEREILFHVAGANPGGQGLSRRPLSGLLSAAAERLPGPYGLVKLRLRVHNTTPWHAPGAPRQEALRHALVAAHTLVAAEGGAFVSQLDPPEWARPAVEGCDNRHTFPVLLGEEGRQELVLSSPIILYDHPSVSPETDTVEVAGVAIGKGSRVRLRPGSGRADAQDLFLADRVATVEAVLADVDGNRHLAVTLDGDPAVDLQRWHGRYLYFAPDELEPL